MVARAEMSSEVAGDTANLAMVASMQGLSQGKKEQLNSNGGNASIRYRLLEG